MTWDQPVWYAQHKKLNLFNELYFKGLPAWDQVLLYLKPFFNLGQLFNILYKQPYENILADDDIKSIYLPQESH